MALTEQTAVSPPPMEFGDRLTRAEFERRWKRMPHVTRAELVEGVVYMPSAVKYRDHGRQHLAVSTILGLYVASTPGTEAADNSSLRLDNDNEPQPDLLLRIDSALGGQSWEDEEGYLNGGPELIVEIAATSASYDLHQKLQAYRRHGVCEYVVWRVYDAAFDWFVLRDGNYTRLESDVDGLLKSTVVGGLWLDTRAILSGDLAGAVKIAQQGLASAEHAEFVRSLETKRAAGK
jgi:Uma2 family endonuclease